MRALRLGMRQQAACRVSLLLAVIMISSLGGHAAASSIADDDQAQAAPTIRPAEATFPIPTYGQQATANHMWVWSAGNRGFFLAGHNYLSALDVAIPSTDPHRRAHGYRFLVGVDLPSGKEVGRLALDPPAWMFAINGASGMEPGLPLTMAVDDVTGQIFIPYSKEIHQTLVNRHDPVAHSCGFLPVSAEVPTSRACVGGVHIVDGASLEATGRIDFSSLRIDTLLVGPVLRGIQHIPAEGTGSSGGDQGKLLLFVEDWGASQWPFLDNVTQSLHSPRKNQAALLYVMQVDVTSRQLDWTYRVDSCRGAREPRSDYQIKQTLPGPVAGFRGEPGVDDAIYVGCHTGSSQTGTIVRVPLDKSGAPVALPVGVDTERVPVLSADASAEEGTDPGKYGAAGLTEPVRVWSGPDRTHEFRSDESAGRLLLRVVDEVNGVSQESWWVFDTGVRDFVGTLGMGRSASDGVQATLDPETGRLYALSPQGLLVADTRRHPLPQPLVFESIRPSPRRAAPAIFHDPDGGTMMFVLGAATVQGFHDALPVSLNPDAISYEGRTLDIAEVEGETTTNLEGAARGYGLRVLLMNGAEAAGRVGPLDAVGNLRGVQQNIAGGVASVDKNSARYFYPDPCTVSNREIVVAFSGPDDAAVVDQAGSRGSVAPVVIDSITQSDTELPISRCLSIGWNEIWSAALFGRSPAEEPSVPLNLQGVAATCISSASERSHSIGDPITSAYGGRVNCEDDATSGWVQVRGVTVAGGVSVASVSSSFRIYRDPGRGLVSRIESLTRGLNVDGLVRVDLIRGVAEAWANGRRQPIAEAQRGSDYDPNCDLDRTAGTCYRRHIFGVASPAYSCGPCGDEAALVDGLNRAFGSNGRVALREPDLDLARGAENGYIAGVQKLDRERFADLVLNNDLLQTTLPSLEIVRYAPQARASGNLFSGGRGRQVYQFAGVEVGAAYSIQCLLVYDEETNTCAAEAQEPGSISVSLSDPEGNALAGGVFEVRKDVDNDGVLGLVDSLVGEGACVTAEDGIGSCTFDDLQPGSYLVSQTVAPEGFAKVEEPWVSEVASGEARTVAFTNASNVSTIDVSATDESGQPVQGAEFAVFPDPDADGKVAADAQPAATCTTDNTGTCSMRVPVGSYVLVQTSAPNGLEGIEPVAFAFTSGGQIAAVGVTNYPAEGGITQPEPQPGPVYSDPAPFSPPVETVDDYTPPVTETDDTPLPQVMGDTIVRVIKAPGDALRLLSRDPQQAAAFTAALILFALAAMAVRRRASATALIHR